MNITSTVITIGFATISPIAHAEFPGEDDGSNVFNEEVASNYRTRTFWTLLTLLVSNVKSNVKWGKLFCWPSSLAEHNTCSRQHDHPGIEQNRNNLSIVHSLLEWKHCHVTLFSPKVCISWYTPREGLMMREWPHTSSSLCTSTSLREVTLGDLTLVDWLRRQ